VADEIADMRLRLSDMEDNQAATMRRLLELKTGGRKDVATLAMALRATRIQHVQRLPTYLRQQLAVETLQLWAPLSFQAGVAAQVPELEVHSYVLLFPRSFNSFISWYTQLQPLARRLLSASRLELERRMQADELLPRLATRVTLQSRIKNPASAFKKLVRNPKQQHQQLHDMLGLRIIVTQRLALARDPFPSSSSSSVLETEAEAGGVLTVEGASGRREGESEAEWTPRAVPDAAASRLRQRQGRGVTEHEAEHEALRRAYKIIQALPGWSEDKGRFKDYVTRPKSSGYQSLHVTLVHAATLMCLEVQIRSARMHDEAENGPAAHNLYKALALPPTVGKDGEAPTQSTTAATV
jgi:(p)ppGpp synthase/HD superfamily hydrolase